MRLLTVKLYCCFNKLRKWDLVIPVFDRCGSITDVSNAKGNTSCTVDANGLYAYMTSLDIVIGKRAKEKSALGVIGEKDRQKSGRVLGTRMKMWHRLTNSLAVISCYCNNPMPNLIS